MGMTQSSLTDMSNLDIPDLSKVDGNKDEKSMSIDTVLTRLGARNEVAAVYDMGQSEDRFVSEADLNTQPIVVTKGLGLTSDLYRNWSNRGAIFSPNSPFGGPANTTTGATQKAESPKAAPVKLRKKAQKNQRPGSVELVKPCEGTGSSLIDSHSGSSKTLDAKSNDSGNPVAVPEDLDPMYEEDRASPIAPSETSSAVLSNIAVTIGDLVNTVPVVVSIHDKIKNKRVKIDITRYLTTNTDLSDVKLCFKKYLKAKKILQKAHFLYDMSTLEKDVGKH